MTRKIKYSIIAVIVVALAIIAAIVVRAATGGHDGHDDTHAMADPTTNDPVVAASFVMGELMTWEPATMASPQDAAALISDRLTGTMLQYAESGQPDPVLPKAWSSWAASNDRVHGVAVLDESREVVIHDTQAEVPLTVTQEVWHSSGKKTPMGSIAVTVEVEKHNGQWLVSSWQQTGTSQ
ncbi:hypothetical protein PAB09_03510 [Corynebacterium sp. SCR221107]|uniref:hypothetical protein n=1 Tax=Corynebacterium sp. SCR221107 TaxID=3017361 RepID=UPI0022EC6A1F|nr:hypothetical protein [Corynebacterium sp. SCR221107]WBT09406.1 hypothetical protein PAB09_03510 [Corynebacterium sp. SCR221107]